MRCTVTITNYKTSFPPHLNNKTTSVAMDNMFKINLITSFLYFNEVNEV